MRDRPSAIRKGHVNHYIGTLDDRDPATMLTILRFEDADDLEETLQECENMEVREAHASMGSNKFRQRLTSQAAQIVAKPIRTVRVWWSGDRYFEESILTVYWRPDDRLTEEVLRFRILDSLPHLVYTSVGRVALFQVNSCQRKT